MAIAMNTEDKGGSDMTWSDICCIRHASYYCLYVKKLRQRPSYSGKRLSISHGRVCLRATIKLLARIQLLCGRAFSRAGRCSFINAQNLSVSAWTACTGRQIVLSREKEHAVKHSNVRGLNGNEVYLTDYDVLQKSNKNISNPDKLLCEAGLCHG